MYLGDKLGCKPSKNKDGIGLSIIYVEQEPVLVPTILGNHAAAKSSN